MAAHDDKISTNRRRLFKALSSVPVVMTLRPGSALANSSAYQCLATARENVGFDPGPVDFAFTQGSAYKYAGPYDYWEIGTPSTPCDLPITTYIVKRNGTFYDDQGNEISSPLPFSESGDYLIFPAEVAVDDACYTVAKKPGYFAIVGNADTADLHFTETGVVPITNNGTQGITGTCMTSLVGAGRYTSLNGG
ncbi:MAG: hypothetical protein R3E46_13110 [Sedimenticolaceae bacterium]